jgi:hypothetical protein
MYLLLYLACAVVSTRLSHLHVPFFNMSASPRARCRPILLSPPLHATAGSGHGVQLAQLQRQMQHVNLKLQILNEVFDYCDDNASASTVPEFKVSLTALAAFGPTKILGLAFCSCSPHVMAVFSLCVM